MFTEELRLATQAVPPPPWHFWGENIHLEYRIDETAFRSFLPKPLIPDDAEMAQIQIAFCNMSCWADAHTAITHGWPADNNYRECLVKLRCRLRETVYWYVPFTWVTGDISLLRGYLQGFPKRIATVEVDRFGTSLHPAFPSRERCQPITGYLAAPSGIMLRGIHIANQSRDRIDCDPLPLLLRRRIPDISLPRTELSDHFVTPVVTFAANSEVWTGVGAIEYASLDPTLACLFNPIGPVHSRSFIGAITIEGTTVVG